MKKTVTVTKYARINKPTIHRIEARKTNRKDAKYTVVPSGYRVDGVERTVNSYGNESIGMTQFTSCQFTTASLFRLS
jgi:hypothetical protein